MKAQELETFLKKNIAVATPMELRVESLTPQSIQVTAPLSANWNHLGTAFGGSQFSLAMFACYGMVVELLDQASALGQYEAVVRDSRCRYRKPVSDELIRAECHYKGEPIGGKKLDRFRLPLSATIYSGTNIGTEVSAEFVLLPMKL